MSSSIYFPVSSVILSLTFVASFFLRFKLPSKENKLLNVMVWYISICSVADLILGLNGSFLQLSKNASLAFNTIYTLAKHLNIICYAVYIVVKTEQKISKWQKCILSIFNVYGLVIIIANIKFRWLFDIDDKGNYVAAEQIYLYYIVALVYVVFSVQHLLRFARSKEWSKNLSLYSYLAIPFLCSWVQYRIPELRIESFGMALVMLWIYLAAPRMDRMIDPNTGVMNQYAFSKKVLFMLERDETQKGFLMVLRFRDISSLQNQNGFDVYMKLMREAAGRLYNKDGVENVYYLQDGRFAVEIVREQEQEAKKVANETLKMLHETWRISGREVEAWVVGALVVVPSDVKGISDIYNYLEYLEIMPALKDCKVYEGKHLDIAYMRRYDEIERAIDRALQKTSFDVYYQPIYGTKEKKIIAAEALLRMYDEEMGFISPEEFIPIAEKNGKIVEIGHMVLESVCQFLKREDIEKYGLRYIEVNLSTIECIQENLPEELDNILDKYQVDVSQINLEITETALAQNREVLAKNMREINDKGIMFSLDDYGTGYSTITYMMTLPFKIVKIDKSILWSSFENEKAMIALCASVNMIKDMGMEIVVEGVESEEMVQKLTELGCDYLQGFYFSKPLPEEKFLEFLRK